MRRNKIKTHRDYVIWDKQGPVSLLIRITENAINIGMEVHPLSRYREVDQSEIREYQRPDKRKKNYI